MRPHGKLPDADQLPATHQVAALTDRSAQRTAANAQLHKRRAQRGHWGSKFEPGGGELGDVDTGGPESQGIAIFHASASKLTVAVAAAQGGAPTAVLTPGITSVALIIAGTARHCLRRFRTSNAGLRPLRHDSQ
jgi:hypothetical protein